MSFVDALHRSAGTARSAGASPGSRLGGLLARISAPRLAARDRAAAPCRAGEPPDHERALDQEKILLAGLGAPLLSYGEWW